MNQIENMQQEIDALREKVKELEAKLREELIKAVQVFEDPKVE